MNPAQYAKAIMAAFVASQVAFAAAILPDSPGGTAVTVNEGILLGIGAVIAALGVYVTSNSGSVNGSYPKE